VPRKMLVWSEVSRVAFISAYLIRHVIPPVRVSNLYVRLQTVSTAMYDIGEEKKYRLPLTLLRGFKIAQAKAIETNKEVERCLEATGKTRAELWEQAQSMQAFYATSSQALEPPDLNDEIFKTLKDIQTIWEWVSACVGGSVPTLAARTALKEIVFRRSEGRIVLPRDTPNSLEEKLNRLLEQAKQTVKDWWNEDGPTALYEGYQQKNALCEIHKTRYELWKVLVQRRCELDRLYGSSTIGNTSLSKEMN